MSIVTLSPNNQITLPSEIQTLWKLKEGDQLQVTVQDDQLILTPVGSNWKRWRGCLKGTSALADHLKEHQNEVDCKNVYSGDLLQ